MNQANQKQLFQQTNQGLLGIRQSEVNYYQGLNVAFGTQAALIGGFTYGVFSQNVVNESNGYQNEDALSSAYWICSSITIALSVHVILCTTLMQVLGPGLALNGPVGSMARATEGMRIEQKPIIRSFIAMMIMFSVATVLSCWVVMDTQGAIGCSLVFAFSACYWYKYCERIYLRFYWDRDEMNWEARGSGVDNPDDTGPGRGRRSSTNNAKRFSKNKKAARPLRFAFFRTRATTRSKSNESDPEGATEVVLDVGGQKGVALSTLGIMKPGSRGIVMEGYLTKRGGGKSYLDFRKEPWERRYFTLTSTGNLFVFKTRQDFRNNPKKPIYTRPLQLEDYFVEVLSVAGDGDSEKKSVMSSVDGDSSLNTYRFQMTLVLRENVRAAQENVTILGSDASSDVVNILTLSSPRSARAASVVSSSSTSTSASTSASVSASVVTSMTSARQQMYRDHWVLRCDTNEELKQWVGVIGALYPSCFASF